MRIRTNLANYARFVGDSRRDLNEKQQERVRELVRELLEKDGWTQAELAKVLGVDQSNISKFLSRTQGISIMTARRLLGLAAERGLLGDLDADAELALIGVHNLPYASTPIPVLNDEAGVPDHLAIPAELQAVLDTPPPDGVKGLWEPVDRWNALNYARFGGGSAADVDWKNLMRIQINARRDSEALLPPKIRTRPVDDDPAPAPALKLVKRAKKT